MRRSNIALPAFALLVLAALLGHLAPSSFAASSEDESRWKERLPDEDRAAVDAGVGYALPEFPEDSLTWLGRAPFESIEDTRGRVVLIQTWSSGTSKGRAAPKRLARALGNDFSGKDLLVILLHTPEGIDRARDYCERNEMPYPVALDRSGRASDHVGAYKRPVNVLVDRNGEVRYAGLHDRGVRDALAKLVAEKADPSDKPRERPEASDASSAGSGEYPEIAGSVGSAQDLRGRPAPPFVVERWITPEPDARGKVAIVDFWATWCGPCIASIPHMNSLANTFRGEVECVGISDERFDRFKTGFEKAKLTPSTFDYSLAIDSRGRMKNAFQVRGIPHVAVISTDWVVRWQGHPSRLTEDIVRQIVEADPGLRNGGGSATAGRPPARWASGG